MPLMQRLALWALRLGSGSTWVFEVSVGAVVGLSVAGLLVWMDGVSWIMALIAGLLAMAPAVVAGAVTMQFARALAESTEQREMLLLDDALTGVYTRRQFVRIAEREWMRCHRYGDDGALLLIDIDHLRRVNDNLGLRCGDAVLREVTRRVNATLRQSDVQSRFGGAELAVFLPHTDPLGALDAAERIRQQVAGVPMRWEQAMVVITVSVGVAHVHTSQNSLDALVQEAEAALQLAKSAGRNCVRAAPVQPRSASGENRSVTPN